MDKAFENIDCMSATLRCQAKNRFYESTQRLIQPRRVLWLLPSNIHHAVAVFSIRELDPGLSPSGKDCPQIRRPLHPSSSPSASPCSTNILRWILPR
jgi:hypothetical protein